MDKNALRACSSFNPSSMIKTFAGEGDRKFLPLEAGLAWFHHYLVDQNVPGLIDDSDLDILQGTPLLIGRASVYINGELVGKSCSGVAITDTRADLMTIGQGVASTAKWRALENAGFGYEDAREKHDILKSQQDMEEVNAMMQDTIRACSYDPLPDMTFITDERGTPNPYLEVPFRVLWFHQWLRDNKVSGYIDDSDIKFYPELKLLVARACVYINGRLVGTSCASKPFDPACPEIYQFNPITYACTQAKGRALINAGFGILAMGQDDKISETPLWPLDNGGPAPIPGIPPLFNNPTKQPVPAAAPPAVPPMEEGDGKAEGQGKVRRGRKPKTSQETKETPAEPQTVATPEQAPEPELPKMPRKEALAFIVPVGPDKIKGKTIGEVLGEDRRFLEYYASEKFVNPKYVDFKRAAIAALKGA